MPPPAAPKIRHIVYRDRLRSIVTDGFLWCDAEARKRPMPGTAIGVSGIKQRRLTNPLKSRPGLHVGDCAPFYLCPRSVMLYVIHKRNHPDLGYRGGQNSIVHPEADLRESVDWADRNERRWAFTLSNAGSRYFEDCCDLAQLGRIDWKAVESRCWQDNRDGKQAEFLVERSFPWTLIERIGVNSDSIGGRVGQAIREAGHQPSVRLMPEWHHRPLKTSPDSRLPDNEGRCRIPDPPRVRRFCNDPCRHRGACSDDPLQDRRYP